MPTGRQLLLQQRGPFATSYVSLGAAGATHEIIPTGVTVAIWGVYVAIAATTTAVTASLRTQANSAFWTIRTVGGTTGVSTKTEFRVPLVSFDGLQVVTTGGAAGVDLCVSYTIIPTT